MDQETFNKKMDELDRKNPRPIKNFYSAERIAAIAASAAAPQVVADGELPPLPACHELMPFKGYPVAAGVCCYSAKQMVEYARAALQAAPVQPVAVFDCGACPGDGTICPKSCKLAEDSPPIAAPAAQGDALADVYQRREAYYAHTGNSTIDYDGREWGDFIGGWDAAIAAKAAS